MKKAYSRFMSLIALILIFATLLTSCVATKPGDEPSDEPNDKPDQDITSDADKDKLYLIKDGRVNFNFVYSYDGYSTEFRNHIFSAISKLNKTGIAVNAVRDDFASVTDCEVLVGTFLGREDYEVSKYVLGNKGYTIRVIGDKVVILGGTEESLKVAFDIFMSQYMSYDEGTRNITLDRSLDRTVREVYDITSMSIGGVELNNGSFKFICDPTDTAALKAAELMRIKLYDSAGYYLDITDEEVENGIYISTTERSEDDGFRAYLKNGSLYIKCQYPGLFASEMIKYLDALVAEDASGNITLDTPYSREVHSISYLECGAVGDGVTDDFEAIKLAHETANEFGLKIVACGSKKSDGLVFNLGVHTESIQIETDVDWTGATFIIDDSGIAPGNKARDTNVFSIVTSLKAGTNLKGTLTSLKKGATDIGNLVLDQSYLCIIYNSNVKQYIRHGANADSGADQQEVIIIHKDGRIDKSTPLLWNYDSITDIRMIPIDDTPITIKGGTFKTIANRAPREYTYYKRGIGITRSNVTVYGVMHLIEGEGDTGAPYNGFLSVSGANNVLFQNIVFSGHKTYRLLTDNNNRMGTYDISASNSNAITWKNCTQANSITDSSLWGIMGSNYCKNLTYDGCALSRFDAHKGMYNTTIINSEIGHAGITAIGEGYLLIENTVINGNNVVSLRNDYGSTWNGEVIIKDVTLKNSTATPTILGGSWYNHYFGYVCHLPSVIIDNLTLKNYSGTVYIFPSFSNNNISSTGTKNPVALGGSVTIRNNAKSYSFKVSTNSYVNGGYRLITE